MGNNQSTQENFQIPQSILQQPVSQEKEKLKPCCACPETKKARDNCIMINGEEKCSKEIEDHKICLRKHGFQA